MAGRANLGVCDELIEKLLFRAQPKLCQDLTFFQFRAVEPQLVSVDLHDKFIAVVFLQRRQLLEARGRTTYGDALLDAVVTCKGKRTAQITCSFFVETESAVESKTTTLTTSCGPHGSASTSS